MALNICLRHILLTGLLKKLQFILMQLFIVKCVPISWFDSFYGRNFFLNSLKGGADGLIKSYCCVELLTSIDGLFAGLFSILTDFILICVPSVGNLTDGTQIKEIPITTLLPSTNRSTPFTVYSLESLETNSYQFALNEIRLEIISGIESACQAIPLLHETCLKHPASCQSVKLSIDNYEKSIRKNGY